jgi:hypothetical protein
LSAVKLAGDPNNPMRIREDANTVELRAEIMKRLADLADDRVIGLASLAVAEVPDDGSAD